MGKIFFLKTTVIIVGLVIGLQVTPVTWAQENPEESEAIEVEATFVPRGLKTPPVNQGSDFQEDLVDNNPNVQSWTPTIFTGEIDNDNNSGPPSPPGGGGGTN